MYRIRDPFSPLFLASVPSDRIATTARPSGDVWQLLDRLDNASVHIHTHQDTLLDIPHKYQQIHSYTTRYRHKAVTSYPFKPNKRQDFSFQILCYTNHTIFVTKEHFCMLLKSVYIKTMHFKQIYLSVNCFLTFDFMLVAIKLKRIIV